ncbi:MAG: hypothetical protein GC208_10490 [Alphaproteobacteria bacterium]|nr:hypothetical protein [Alphaproteobacteria bacterium]
MPEHRELSEQEVWHIHPTDGEPTTKPEALATDCEEGMLMKLAARLRDKQLRSPEPWRGLAIEHVDAAVNYIVTGKTPKVVIQ